MRRWSGILVAFLVGVGLLTLSSATPPQNVTVASGPGYHLTAWMECAPPKLITKGEDSVTCNVTVRNSGSAPLEDPVIGCLLCQR